MSRHFNDCRLKAIFERRQTSQRGDPLEIKWRKTSWRWIFSRHNADLGLVALAYLIVLLVALGILLTSGLMQSPTGLAQGLQILFGTAIFGTFMELLRRTYDRAIKRLATINLFTSEMLSIMRVFTAGNIIGEFVRLYDQLNSPAPNAPRRWLQRPRVHEMQMPSGLADVARKENYFSIFEKNSSDLALLNPATINDITAFYTFLKGARDATGAMQLWGAEAYSTESKIADIIAVIYLCFLMTLHGQIALDQLVNSKENRIVIEDIFAGVQIQCFSFLDIALPKDDFRRVRIDQRRETVDALRTKHGYAF